MQVVKQRQTVFLYLPKHGGAQGQEDGLAGADAAASPPQAGGDAVTQQLPAAAGQGDDCLLYTSIQQHAAGDTLSITVAREGQMQTVSLTLGEKNAQTQQAQKNS